MKPTHHERDVVHVVHLEVTSRKELLAKGIRPGVLGVSVVIINYNSSYQHVCRFA
jgi:hypothetical protein